MTIDELGRMVAEGFNSMQKYMDEKFSAIDQRFDAVEERLDLVESGLRTVNERIDTVVIPAIDDHSRRIKELELTVN